MFLTLKSVPGPGSQGMEQVKARKTARHRAERIQTSEQSPCDPCRESNAQCVDQLPICSRCERLAIPCTRSAERTKKRPRADGPAVIRFRAFEPRAASDAATTSVSNLSHDSGALPPTPASTANPPTVEPQHTPDILDEVYSRDLLYDGYFDDGFLHLQVGTAGHDAAAGSDCSPWQLPANVPLRHNGHAPAVAAPPSAPDTLFPSCSCVDDAVGIMQKLDDDEFGLSSLTLDQALQLQRRLVSYCMNPLDCARCGPRQAGQAVIVAICSRLVEMLECTQIRLSRLCRGCRHRSSDSHHTAVASNDSADAVAADMSHPGLVGDQLFCGTTGAPSSTVLCNPALFSALFRGLYSDEEQIHMIYGLLRMQVNRFRKLLCRLLELSQHEVLGSVARRSRVQSLLDRVGRAEESINKVLSVYCTSFEESRAPGPLWSL